MEIKCWPGRRAAIGIALWPVLLVSSGCHDTAPAPSAEVEKPGIASTVHTGDPKLATQLIRGFYGIEASSWRWTKQQFSVVLRPPAGSAEAGANLVMRLSVPEAVIQKQQTISLSGMVGDAALPAETYTKPGPYTYTRPVPAKALAGESVQVDFQLDKVMPPAPPDKRELGVVVESIGLEPK